MSDQFAPDLDHLNERFSAEPTGYRIGIRLCSAIYDPKFSGFGILIKPRKRRRASKGWRKHVRRMKAKGAE